VEQDEESSTLTSSVEVVDERHEKDQPSSKNNIVTPINRDSESDVAPRSSDNDGEKIKERAARAVRNSEEDVNDMREEGKVTGKQYNKTTEDQREIRDNGVGANCNVSNNGGQLLSTKQENSGPKNETKEDISKQEEIDQVHEDGTTQTNEPGTSLEEVSAAESVASESVVPSDRASVVGVASNEGLEVPAHNSDGTSESEQELFIGESGDTIETSKEQTIQLSSDKAPHFDSDSDEEFFVGESDNAIEDSSKKEGDEVETNSEKDDSGEASSAYPEADHAIQSKQNKGDTSGNKVDTTEETASARSTESQAYGKNMENTTKEASKEPPLSESNNQPSATTNPSGLSAAALAAIAAAQTDMESMLQVPPSDKEQTKKKKESKSKKKDKKKKREIAH
jgi:hypothetical protein